MAAKAFIAKPTGRQGVWDAIRAWKGESFIDRDIGRQTDIGRDIVRQYLACLVAAGIVERTSSGSRFKADSYRLLTDLGSEAPRYNKKGEPVTKGRPTEQMWRTVKMLRSFTSADLAINASTEEFPVNEDHARQYCAILAKAGYLLTHPYTAKIPLYAFIPSRNTGPKPPTLLRPQVVYDPNERQIVWHADLDE